MTFQELLDRHVERELRAKYDYTTVKNYLSEFTLGELIAIYEHKYNLTKTTVSAHDLTLNDLMLYCGNELARLLRDKNRLFMSEKIANDLFETLSKASE